ncbi:hypothetical protein [Ornithinimicrobium pratense]|uniref:hypothetical protein n=1 Tax=Ornithinimicrobium pratense TaxID=2593973 RepID=UPI001EE2E92F|nr:hypothetical protein [Ornithinimicrobium pratense]
MSRALQLRRASPGPRHPSLAADALPTTRGDAARHLLNWVNLSTPLGLVLARAGGARLRRGPRRSILADYYRWAFPTGGAFTVGDVIISRHDLDLLVARRPALFGHELTHSRQWAACQGLPFLPLYAASMAWSWLRTGDRASRSFFERQAGLEDGGYAEVPTRPLRPVLAQAARRLRGSHRIPSGL